MRATKSIINWIIVCTIVLFAFPLSVFASVGFTENKGQIADMEGNVRNDILFTTEGGGTSLFIRKTGLSYVFHKSDDITEEQMENTRLMNNVKYYTHRVDLEFIGCNPEAHVNKTGELPGYKNFYYVHCSKGIRNVRSYTTLEQKNIYDKIDLIYKGSRSEGLKYDLIVNPGGDPRQIQLKYTGADNIFLEEGKLFIASSLGEMTELLPRVFQTIGKKIVDVKCEYVLDGTSISFKLGTWNKNIPLVIDPWLSYFGGNGREKGHSVSTDALGNSVFVGNTTGSNFPILGAYQTTYGGGSEDAYITKMDVSGNLIWSTYYGGTLGEDALGVAVDANNNICVVGSTNSSNLPIGAIGGQTSWQATKGSSTDAFLLKLDPNGSLIWSTYYGGNNIDWGMDVCFDGNSNVFLYGHTNSTNAISTGGSFQTGLSGFSDAFVVKFSPTGNRIWGTYCGSTGNEISNGIACDQLGDLYICGRTNSALFPVTTGSHQTVMGGITDAYLVKFSNNGQRLWATFYGGSAMEYGSAIAVDNNNNVFLAGRTTGSLNGIATAGANQSLLAGGMDGFVVKFNAAGVRLWGTYMGGTSNDYATGVDVDVNNNVVVGGDTYSNDFPVSACAYETTSNGEVQFIQTFTPNGSLICSGYVGGTVAPHHNETEDRGGTVAVGGAYAYITGWSRCTYSATLNAYQPTCGGGFSDATFSQLCITTCGLPNTLVSFAADTTILCEKVDVVNFTLQNTSCDATNTTYLWAFQGASISTSTLQNPVGITYPSTGTYNVSVKIMSPCDTIDVLKQNYINVISCTCVPTSHTLTAFACNNYNSPSGKVFSTSGVYQDTIPNAAGCDSLLTINLTIGSPIITSATQSICMGQSAIIHGNSESTAGIYTQTFTAIGGCDSISSITLNVNSPSNHTITVSSCSNYAHNGQNYTASGVYTQTLVNANGCDSILSINLTVNSPVNTNGSQSICAGQSAIIHGNSEGSAGVYTQTFTAANGCDSISSITLTLHPVSSNTLTPFSCNTYSSPSGKIFSTSGVYQDTILNAAGCDSLLTINLTIGSPINTTNTLNICPGQSSIVHGVSQSTAGVYTQTSTAVGGCDSISTVTLNMYSVSGDTINVNSCNTYIHNGQTYSNTGIYTQTLSNTNGCDSILTIDLTINSPVNTTGTQSICPGQSTLVHGVSRNTSGVYTQTYTAINGCDSISSVMLNVSPAITNTVAISACNPYVHNGQSYTSSGIYTQSLTSMSGCDSVLTILFTLNSVTQNTVTISACNSYTHNTQTYNTSGIYSQTLTNAFDCDSLLTINLTINNNITTSDTQNICEGGTAVIHGTNRVTPGIYTQTLSAITGCDSISSIILIVHPAAIASFSATPQPASILYPTVKFTDLSQQADEWSWNFGDTYNSGSTEQHPRFTYPDTGKYEVRLVVNNSDGCSDSIVQQIIIVGEYIIYVPNSFTPNGDGVNDVFLPKGMNIDPEEYELYIFDRWGEEIFISRDHAKGWDGRANGGSNIAQIDTYVWIIRLKDVQGGKYRYVGHVNLIK